MMTYPPLLSNDRCIVDQIVTSLTCGASKKISPLGTIICNVRCGGPNNYVMNAQVGVYQDPLVVFILISL